MRSTLVRHVLAALLSISPLGDAKAATASDPAGVWLTQSGDAKVKVSRCGSALCGRVVWLKEPIDKKTGKPQLDDHNSDPALRGRKIIGISLFIDNADDGKTYVSTVTLLPSGHLSVQGCMGTLCAGEDWTR